MTLRAQFGRLFDRLFMIEYWTLGIARFNAAELVDSGRLGPIDWCADRSMRGFRADPFLWSIDGDRRVVYEHFDYWRGRAFIASVSIADLSRGGPVRREIDGPFHYSYPFVLQSDGVWYCVPECAESRGVSLYRWSSNEARWSLVAPLLDGLEVLDPTLFHHDRMWYLFGTLRNDEPNSALRAWWSMDLRGPWKSHVRDPVKRDPASSRPAGSLFRVGGHLYRPAQDSREGYGSAITINRVDALSPSDFDETTVSRLTPASDSAYPRGIHSICTDDEFAIVDGKTRRFHPAASVLKTIWLVRSLRRRRGHRFSTMRSTG